MAGSTHGRHWVTAAGPKIFGFAWLILSDSIQLLGRECCVPAIWQVVSGGFNLFSNYSSPLEDVSQLALRSLAAPGSPDIQGIGEHSGERLGSFADASL